MTDVFDKHKRSEVMSRIPSKNTKLELTIRNDLYKAGFRGYRLGVKLPGSPDITFPKAKIAIFVDGCFWHGCPLCYSEPETNAQFWRKKIADNLERDQKVNKNLIGIRWSIIRIWEHSIEKDLANCIQTIGEALQSADTEKSGKLTIL